MQPEDYLNYSDDKKQKHCQDLNPYDKSDWLIFKKIEKLFIEKYGRHEAIDKVFCGLAPTLGPFNCINVYIGKNRKRIKLPETFHGFPLNKIYESKTKNYVELINQKIDKK